MSESPPQQAFEGIKRYGKEIIILCTSLTLKDEVLQKGAADARKIFNRCRIIALHANAKERVKEIMKHLRSLVSFYS